MPSVADNPRVPGPQYLVAGRYRLLSRIGGGGMATFLAHSIGASNAATLLFTYERLFTPNVGLELVIGVPPKIKAKATGSVAFLGDDVLSARNVAPTLILNYHFGSDGDRFRPYLGAGINYTKFTSVKSKLAPDVKMSDSTGLVVQAGLDYAFDKTWGLFASVARVDTKSKLVAAGTTVLTTEIDFRPVTYSFGVSYRY